jgi:hypothetical protein
MKVGVFIVGAPKAGTTSLFHYLDTHPDILMSSVKEPDYFSDKELLSQSLYYGGSRVDTIEKYNSLFPDGNDGKILGEGSVSYLFYPEVPLRIKKYNSESKIIIMLRNPVERAFSHFLMDYRLGLTSVSFEAEFHKKEGLNFQQYFLLGNYSTQINRYVKVFGRENIHVIWYSDFKKNSEKEVKKVFNFIGVNSSPKIDFGTVHNSFTMPKNNFIRMIYSVVWLRKTLTLMFPSKLIKSVRNLFFREGNKPKLQEDLRRKIQLYYQNEIKELEQVLSVNLSRWIK